MVVAAILVAYAGLCAVVFFKQRGMVYFGGHTRVEASETGFALARDDGVVLHGWVSNPGQRDVLLFFGGNAESVQYARDEFAGWVPARTGYFVAYRGYGASDGAPSQAALPDDALALYDDVAARHPGARIAVVGRSLGSGVAAHVAARRPVDRLVLVTPYDSLANVAAAHYPWLPTRWLVTERYDSAAALRAYRGDVLVIRSIDDTVIPPASTDRLIAALPRPPQMVSLSGTGHDLSLATPDALAALRAFLAPDD